MKDGCQNDEAYIIENRTRVASLTIQDKTGEKGMKKFFWLTGCTAVFVCLICLSTGCARKGKGAYQDKEVEVDSLREQIRLLRAELESVRQELNLERQTSFELAQLLSRSRTEGIAEDGNALASVKVPLAAEDSQSASKIRQLSEEVARLKSENSRLAAELYSKRSSVVFSADRKQPSSPEVFTVNSSGSSAIKNAYDSFVQGTTSSERLAILESMMEVAFEQKPELLALLDRALEDPDPDVVRMAAEMLEPYRNAAVLPLIEKALHSRDEDVRFCALGPLEDIEDPKSADLAVLALSDPSETIRGRALDVIRGQPSAIQILALKKAFGSVSDEVKSEVLGLLELRGDKAAVEVILNGLKDPNPEFREEVKGVLQVLLDQEFNNYNQAIRWWKANRHRYDENLFEQ